MTKQPLPETNAPKPAKQTIAEYRAMEDQIIARMSKVKQYPVGFDDADFDIKPK